MTDLERLEMIFETKNIKAMRLDLGEACVGSTSYIDKIDVSNFPRGVCYGLDHFGRAYVAVAVHRQDKWERPERYKRDIVAVAFKRYTDGNTWVCSQPQFNGNLEACVTEFLGYMVEGKPYMPDNDDVRQTFTML